MTALAFASIGIVFTSSSHAQDLRFATTAPGTVLATGNTLGLSKENNGNGPGVEDSIGTFISLTTTSDDSPFNFLNPWPQYTTNDWTENGSEAVLALPEGAEVLYAELLWGGSYQYEDDVSAFLETPVTLSSGASSMAISPDAATPLTIAEQAASGFAARYYMRSADVTAFVQGIGGASYAVAGVPATQTTTINSLNAAGWTLVVAVRNEAEPIRNLSVFVGGSFVDEDTQQDYTVSGFCAPPAGMFAGSAVISTIEGDADLTGDKLQTAPTAAGPFVGLSGVNNPADNFFCSQINGPTGQLDTVGSFGTVNHDASLGLNGIGARQGWDITSVPLSSAAGQLQNGQTSAVLRTITTGDSFVPILAAFAIDVNAPDFAGSVGTIVASKTSVIVGDQITLTLDVENTGGVTAEAFELAMPMPAGISLVSFTTDGIAGDIDGNLVDAAALAAGVDEGTLGGGQTRQVVMVLDVDAPSGDDSYDFAATWSYDFIVCAGDPALTESFTQYAIVGYDAPEESTSATTTAGAGGAGSGGALGSGGEGAGDPSTGGGDPGNEDEREILDSSCGCSLPGAAPRSGLAAVLGLVAMAWRARRRYE